MFLHSVQLSALARRSFLPACLVLLFCASPSLAGTFTAFGPQTYERGTGGPVTVINSFSVLNPSTQYTIRIHNGGLEDGEFELVSSTIISINGVQVVGPNEFNQNVTLVEKSVTVLEANEIAVEVRGKPGGALTIEIIGVDNDPPTITVTATPTPNAAGWNNTDVTVSFDCTDATSGVDTCPSPITVTTEGAGQVISGEAKDLAGNTATASAAINIDKTPPTINSTVSPQSNTNGWHNTDVTISFTATDALSGIASVTDQVTLTTEGASQAVSGTATDLADNSATASVAINLDKTPPGVGISSPTDGTTLSNSPASVTGTITDTLSGIAGVTCNATPISLSNSTFTCDVPLTEGANTIVVQAVDLAGNTGSSIVSVTLSTVDTIPPTIVATISPVPNANGWNNTDVTVTFDCTDDSSGVAQCSVPTVVSAEGANQTVTGTATDQAGNTATASVTVNLDKTPPSVGITSPTDGTILNTDTVSVEGTISDGLSGVASVTCDGTPATISNSIFSCDVPLADGENLIFVEATDLAGRASSSRLGVTFVRGPRVGIISPPSLSLFSSSPITVSGTVDDASAAVVVNGVSAVVSAGTFTAVGVPLQEGSNTITAIATDSGGNVGTASIAVILDVTPPTVLIDSPSDGTTLTQAAVTITGRVNDLTAATGTAGAPTVAVNGIPAQVSNGTFLVVDLPLRRGPNSIIATAQDQAGNSSSQTISVTLQDLAGQRINLVAGNNQSGAIGTVLPNLLVASLTDVDGNPVPGRVVSFSVTRGEGTVSTASQQGRILNVPTDASGTAQVSFALGSRTGAGNQRVTASAAGFVGEVIFCASATTTGASQIKIVSGENQRGVVGQPLTQPFVVFVHDEGGNPVAGVPVTFQMTQGGGNIQGSSSATEVSDSAGHASAVLTLGADTPINNNVVQASFEGMSGLPATFTATGVIPGPPAGTSVSGVVLDNSNLPVEGGTASIEGTSLQAVTDAQGQFSIANVPVGTHELIIDGSTTTRPGVWPSLAFEINAISGRDNTIGMPIFLLPLDAANAKIVGGSEDVTLTLTDVPGFSLTVFANSATFPDGSTTGQVSVTQVHADKVPMPPQEGAAPRLVLTIQPAGVIFDPPAKATYPNVYDLKPGQVVNLFSFDHDLGEFVNVGTGSVSEDGSLITSDPAVGVRKSGWHFPPPPAPPTTDISTDFDGDGIPDIIDPDDDNDGIPDKDDQFPHWVDGDVNNPPPDRDGINGPDLPDEFVNTTYDNAEGLFDEGVERAQTSDYGWRSLEDEETGTLELDFHGGIDIHTEGGETIHASDAVGPNARVIHAGDADLIGFGPGQAVLINNGDGTFSVYTHLQEVRVGLGEVSSGAIIGIGSNGRPGAHLHYGEFQGPGQNDNTATDPQQ